MAQDGWHFLRAEEGVKYGERAAFTDVPDFFPSGNGAGAWQPTAPMTHGDYVTPPIMHDSMRKNVASNKKNVSTKTQPGAFETITHVCDDWHETRHRAALMERQIHLAKQPDGHPFRSTCQNTKYRGFASPREIYGGPPRRPKGRPRPATARPTYRRRTEAPFEV
mmetsp:Transcript_41526/g.102154  ORF Transcript_41526/g.102154 Transcript_41526/m.102154 type:complete len:165 (+) Transcript_41526:1-495(+)